MTQSLSGQYLARLSLFPSPLAGLDNTMPEQPLPFNRLITDMVAAAHIAEHGATAIIRKTAAELRDKAFCQFVWGE